MNRKGLSNIRLVGIILGIVASLMVVFPAVVTKNSENVYSGLQVAFGYEFTNLGNIASGQIEFSILNCIAFALPVIGALFLLLSKHGHIISAIIFGAAAIMFFFVPDFTVVSVTVLNTVNEVAVEWNYGYGLIIAGIVSILAALISIFGALGE